MRMKYASAVLTLAALIVADCPQALAHVVVGDRIFPVTLTFDDPGVNDEVSLPALDYSRDGVDGGVGPVHNIDLGFEFDKTITANTALILNDGYTIQPTNNGKTQAGWDNLFLTGKWQAYTNDDHEFVMSLGLTREFGGTGATHVGADRFGSTAPNLYFGKGMGDLPIEYLRPIAVTGELSYQVADVGLKSVQTDDGPAFNNGANNMWSGGISLQYSLQYLNANVHDYDLPDFVDHLIPIVEFTWSSPASSPSNGGTTWQASPGLIYLTNWGEVGLEAAIPLNRASGTTVGAVGLVHFFLDDLMPNSLGKPIF